MISRESTFIQAPCVNDKKRGAPIAENSRSRAVEISRSRAARLLGNCSDLGISEICLTKCCAIHGANLTSKFREVQWAPWIAQHLVKLISEIQRSLIRQISELQRS